MFVLFAIGLAGCKLLSRYQRNNPFKCGWYFQSLPKAKVYYDSVLAPFQLQTGDIVANIGSGSGWEECIWLTFKDSINFYAEDIDTVCLNQGDIQKAISYYSKLRGAAINNKIETVI